MTEPGPIIKWVGGKTKLLPELRSRMPRTWGRYFEPFVGGAALFFAVAPERAVLGDTNEALISLYRAVVSDVESIIRGLDYHKKAHDQVGLHYYSVRARWNSGEMTDPAARAAAFIYMNKTCYNGLWRVNRAGRFNVPVGRYINPSIYDPEELRAAATALAAVTLQVAGYGETSSEAKAGDFVYFDPPYDPINKTSNFTAYTKDAFGKDQQKLLADHARVLANRGVHVMLSNNDTSYVRSLYEGFVIDTVQCSRAINSKADKRGAVDEVIITSYAKGT